MNLTPSAQQNFTIKESDLEKQMFSKLQPNDQHIINRVYLAGMKILFSPQTHQKMLQEFEGQLQKGVDVGSLIGTDIAHIMVLLFNESKGTMPKGALIPAGTLLVAKAFEFLNGDRVAQVTDKDFSTAVHVMSAAVMAKFDNGFNGKMQQAGGQQTPPGGSPAAPGASPATPAPAPQPGMMQTGGQPNA